MCPWCGKTIATCAAVVVCLGGASAADAPRHVASHHVPPGGIGAQPAERTDQPHPAETEVTLPPNRGMAVEIPSPFRLDDLSFGRLDKNGLA
jgi:hypothetical protein